MRASHSALRVPKPTTPSVHPQKAPHAPEPEALPSRSQPQLVTPAHSSSGNHEDGRRPEPPLRMYTEEQVAEMLQVSLSQMRKWRMKQPDGRHQGPPFRKIGRLVRYPEGALRAYINGDFEP